VARWEFYECSVDERRAFVSVDVDLHRLAPIASLPVSICLTVPLLAPREDGLNTAEERPALDAIEDLLDEAFAREGAIKAGRAVFDGLRHHYFYGRAVDVLEPALRRARAVVVDRPISASSFDDPEWRQYLEFLYPNELAWQYIMDSRVLDALQAKGDDGEVSRKIDHWAYFARAEDRERFAAALGDHDVRVDGRRDDDDRSRPRPFALYFSHQGPPRRIRRLTSRLHVVARECGGEYDGWECQVLAPGDTPTA
jgi:hypothetical protein